jgi:hypothetical protein
VRAVVIGGIGTLVVTGLSAWAFPSLRKADALTAESLLAEIDAEATLEPVD